MSEAAGLVIEGVGLAAVFDVAANAFGRVETGMAYGKDYQEAALGLAMLQLRLVRWRNTVKIVDRTSKEHKGLPMAPKDKVKDLHDLLGLIVRTFDDAEKTVKRHERNFGSRPFSPPTAGSKTIDALEYEVRKLVYQRGRIASVPQKARWSFHDQRFFNETLASLTRQVTEVLELFPGKYYQAHQKALAQFTQDDAKRLAEVSSRVEKPATMYGNPAMQQKAKAPQGQWVDYRDPGRTSGIISMSKDARAYVGTKVGGPSIFDD